MLCPTTKPFLSLWVDDWALYGGVNLTEEAAPIVGEFDCFWRHLKYSNVILYQTSHLLKHARKLDYRACPVYYLQVLFPVEDDGLCLHLSILDIHLVPTQHDGNVFTNPYQISMPVGNILVSDSGRHVKHDNCTLSLNVVAVPEPPKLLLAGCVPHIEANGPSVCVED